jgi:hypothetical protein
VKQWLPNVLVVGPSRCGKDTFAKMLADATGLKYAGSMSELIAADFAKENETTVDFEMARRHENRQKWFEKGNEMRKGDPCALLRAGFAKGQILTGARNRRELLIGWAIYDAVIWVERPGVGEDPTLEFGMADLPVDKGIVAMNYGDMEFLKKVLGEVVDDLKDLTGATP